MLARRAGALAIAIVVLAVIFFGYRAYSASQTTQALKNYDSEVTALLEGEQAQVSQPVFNSLEGAPGTAGQQLVALQNNLQQDAVTARLDADTAAGWSVPGSVAGAQQDLLLVLNMRYEALSKVAAYIEPALQNESLSAIKNIAGAMDMIYASDIVYDVRVVPLIEQALVDDGIQVAGAGAGGVSLGGTQLPPSKPFLPDQSWTIAGYVAGKILGATPTQLGGVLGAGTHGHKIIGVEAGNTELTSTTNINRVPYTKGMNFTVSFENDGSNDEFGVITQVKLSSAQTAPIVSQAATKETLPGQTTQVLVPLTTTPKIGVVLALTATIEPVNGEKDDSNNTLQYYVEFTQS